MLILEVKAVSKYIHLWPLQPWFSPELTLYRTEEIMPDIKREIKPRSQEDGQG